MNTDLSKINVGLIKLNPDQTLSYHPASFGRGFQLNSLQQAVEVSLKVSEKKKLLITLCITASLAAYIIAKIAHSTLTKTTAGIIGLSIILISLAATHFIYFRTKKSLTKNLPPSSYRMSIVESWLRQSSNYPFILNLSFLSFLLIYPFIGAADMYSQGGGTSKIEVTLLIGLTVYILPLIYLVLKAMRRQSKHGPTWKEFEKLVRESD